MSPRIICRAPVHRTHTFYVVVGNREYYLFEQDFRQGVHKYYGNGLCLDDALDHSRAHRDSAVMRTMTKLPAYIRYAEKEYRISVFKKQPSKRRAESPNAPCGQPSSVLK